MSKLFVYIDNSNVFIEGARLSAVKKQMPGAATLIEAMNNRVVDQTWHLDYGALQCLATCDLTRISVARLWGSPPPSDSFWKMVESFGFEVKVYEKNAAGKEKKIDTAITYRISKDAYKGVIQKGVDEILLLAGDKDYVPAIEDLVEEGFIVNVMFWPTAAKELKEACSKFIPLDEKDLDFLTQEWKPTV